MTPIAAFEREPYRRSLTTKVVRTSDPRETEVWAVLEDTICYPEGGGQPADRGHLDGTRILDVRRVEDEIRHTLEAPLATGAEIEIKLDWERRFDHMQQHTAQHLITAIAADSFDWQTTSFHLGNDRSDIELSVQSPSEGEIQELERQVAREVRAARNVTARRVSAEEYGQLKVRSRGLPDGHTGDIRLVSIAGVDLNTCGGTHVANTAELETVKLLGAESIRGGTRLYFLAGERVRKRLHFHELKATQLRSLLGTGDESVVETIAARLESQREDQRQIKTLESELAEAVAAGLAASQEVRLFCHFPPRSMGFLQRVARAVVLAKPAARLLLTAGEGREGVFLLAVGESTGADLRAEGNQVARVLEGRGGGSGLIYQGKATRLDRGKAALDALPDA